MTFGEMNTGIVPHDPYATPTKPLPNGGLCARDINRFEIMFGGTPDEIMGHPDGNLGSSLLLAGGIVAVVGFAMTLKIKLEASTRPGLQAGSQQLRIDARLELGKYYNPFTGQTGGKDIGTHIHFNEVTKWQ